MNEQLKKPFADLLPPLSTEQFAALKADIKANKVRQPIDVDESGNILDGHHRYKIDKNAPRKVIRGLTKAEKEAHAFRSNIARRNMSTEQRKAVDKRMKETAKRLYAEKRSQPKIAMLLGVSQQTVSYWLTPDTKIGKRRKYPVTAKVKPDEAPEIIERLDAGDTQAQVAADYGVGQQQVSRIARKERKQQAKKAERAKAVKKLGGKKLGIHHGDFRKIGKIVEDNSVDLIFTDPPYDRESIPLYGALAEFAARVLKPGGWCITYSGHHILPDVFALMTPHLAYAWMFATLNTHGTATMQPLKLFITWKPILAFYKPPRTVLWKTFRDSLIAAAPEKTEDLITGTANWQQPVMHAEYFIEPMCPMGGIVVDPMIGNGTTAIAAKHLKRQCVGFELDKRKAENARARLMEDGKR